MLAAVNFPVHLVDQHIARKCFAVKRLQTLSPKKLMREKKSKEDEQTLEELNSAHCHLQAKCQFNLVQTSYIKRIKLFLFLPYNERLINRAKLVYMGES